MTTPHHRAGLVRLTLALVAVTTLAVLAVTLARLNTRLSAQERANHRTAVESQAIVSANEQITARLNQLSTLAVTAQSALSGTGALAGVLQCLQAALATAEQTAAAGRIGAAASQSGLGGIAVLVTALNQQTAAMVASSSHVSTQGASLVAVLRAIVADLTTAVADVARIQRSLAGLP